MSADLTGGVDLSGGYFKAYRKTLNSDIWNSDPLTLKVWFWVLAKAAWQDRSILFNGIPIVLKAGQFILGRRTAASDIHCGEQELRTRLEWLKLTHQITLKVTHRYSIVTVCNWEAYQSSDNETNPPTNPLTNQPTETVTETVTTRSQPARNHKEEGKACKEGEEGEEERREHLAPASAGDEDEAPPPDGQIAHLNTGKAKGKKAPKEKKPRERDPYFDGLASLFRIDPAGTGGGRIAKLKKNFQEHAGADLAEVERRAEVYRALHPTWEFSGEAVEKHWGELDGADGDSWEIGYKDRSEEVANAMNQPQYGFDWWADMRHEPAFKKAAAERGLTLQQYLDCRKAWSDKHGPYTPDNLSPPEEAYARPVEAVAEQPKESP
jgi:hypothetical protein